MIGELKSKLADVARAKETNKRQTRQQLVLAVTRGDKLDPDQAIATMDAVGITGDELEAECQRLDRRLAWAGTLALRPKAETDLADARIESDALEAEWKAIEEKFELRRHAIANRHSKAAGIIANAMDAENELYRTATGIDELAEVERCETELAELLGMRNRLEKELTSAKGRLSEPQRCLDRTSTADESGQEHFGNQIEAIESTIERVNSDLTQLAPQIDAKAAEVSEARQQLLKPECI